MAQKRRKSEAQNLEDHRVRLENVEKQQQIVKFIESHACFELVKKECSQVQVDSLVAQLRSLAATAGVQDVSAIEELLAKTFVKK